ncbi:class I SAM-dependent methyltransferase [Wenxinia marina]|uniref:Methylase involved in ubiquinone/menaquinone biosynthesis n=1 Tax=Wenxinia marina DSM 24838 TaxID=1123501 RepID=A0A0D0PYB0_9RHOB|nr:class I SAM-dependent methyltransferase [Wenxinia marina]KIQ67414.1 Methylase involved in ubiquinone/menaquinone biosynthesis [Wenxinia marina DSM 24838]GGL69669.1 hypothetical protein GCM10011392_25220 [Wenxinia marina]
MTDAAFWDRIADKYAARPIADPDAYEATLERTAGHLAPTDRILELGCGTGGTARRLASSVAHVTATDIAPQMIRIATERQAAEGISNVEHLALPADADVPGAPFDAVVAFNLLHLSGPLAPALAHIRTQVGSGGLFISKTPCLGDMFFGIRLVLPLMRRFGKAPRATFFSAAQLRSEVERAGFEVVDDTTFGAAKNARYLVARRR